MCTVWLLFLGDSAGLLDRLFRFMRLAVSKYSAFMMRAEFFCTVQILYMGWHGTVGLILLTSSLGSRLRVMSSTVGIFLILQDLQPVL